MRDSSKMHQVYGTAYYIAPEVLGGDYTEKCDLWSIGVILYVMLSGKPPFPGKSDDAIIEKVKEGSYTFPDREWSNITPEAKDLIRKLMDKNIKTRLSASEALQHPWIKSMVALKVDKEVMLGSINNLKSFNAENKLRQATLTFMVTQLSSKKEQQQLRDSFN